MRDASGSEQPARISALTAALIVLWPALLWGVAFGIVWLAEIYGCKIWARGVEVCIVLGMDIGGMLYPLWALGCFLVLVVLWVPVGLILLGILWFSRRSSP